MARQVNIEVTEHYTLWIADDADGTDAVIALDDLDEDDTASAYDHRDLKVSDRNTGEELPVDESEV